MPACPLTASTALHVRPFQAVRYDADRAGDLSGLLCPPYDTMEPARAQALRRPHHLARLLYARNPRTAAGQLERWQQDGILRRDPHPAFYVYQQQLGARILQRGLIGELDLLEHGNPAPVLPHEDVQPSVVRQRAAHMAGLGAQLEPLLLTYRSTESTTAQLIDHVTRRPPVAYARIGRLTHVLWACTDPGEQALISAGLSRYQALIADGHHRYAACRDLNTHGDPDQWRYSLALLVDSTSSPVELTAIHRLVSGLEADKAAAAAADVARVRPLPGGPRPPEPGELVVTGAGRAWSVRDPDEEALKDALAGCPPQWHSLPAAIADHLLLAGAWSVPDLPGAVAHVHDTSQAIAAAAAPGGGTAVLLPALTEGTVRELAGAGVLLPRKSTSFGPKPVAGMVLRVLSAP